MGDSSYKGVSAAQDSRFTNKESTLLRKLKFPPSFDTKVDMTKVELSVIKPWIAQRVTSLLGFEDDVVLEYASGMLEEQRFPDPRKVQIQLMGFLEGKTAEFMSELWELLVSAQESPGGVPKRFVEEKKEELRRKREEADSVVREARERARRAAEASAGGDVTRRRSRWDAGAPSTSNDPRPPAYTSNDFQRRNEGRPSKNDWNRRRGDDPYQRERNGNGTGRARDSGWGARAPRDPHSSRRSPSPPPRNRRRSPSRTPSPPPHRQQQQQQRSRSRSRSVTPDYRASLRERKRPATQKEDVHHDGRLEPSETNPGVREEESEDLRSSTRRRDADTNDEADRQRDLRDKLMRAKASRGSTGRE